MDALSKDDVPALRTLTAALLPVKYPDTFFTDPTLDQIVADLTRVLTIHGPPVGWIRCRLDIEEGPSPAFQQTSGATAYIQALCLLPPYRGLALGRALVEYVCHTAKQKYAAAYVSAHVWEDNVAALQWYERQGFRKIEMVDSYYRKLRPAGAWLMQRDLA